MRTLLTVLTTRLPPVAADSRHLGNKMNFYPVSKAVNSVTNIEPKQIERVNLNQRMRLNEWFLHLPLYHAAIH